ncbi:TfuA-like protein [Leisingera sp. ANG-Vp]|uniref:TfuA-like protein n=1 Tax=Leisingera sp. ANG-Vp TaxID=1577896 RepID=UPI0006895678|nr:TfuA-like protein [Leisingera sp. ANG-Vp]
MTTHTSDVVFVGPTAKISDLQKYLPKADFLPPIARGDLYRARANGARRMLIIDGVFSQTLAVSPREVMDVLKDGAEVAGASSMGALRAAECWPAGMKGYGSIYRLYRRGILTSDDEVAVLTNPAAKDAAITYALINVRYALRCLERFGLISEPQSRHILRTASKLHYSERDLRTWGTDADISEDIARKMVAFDLKARDANLAARFFSKDQAPKQGLRRIAQLGPQQRYHGSDAKFGLTEDELKPRLLRWLFGSGRYQAYIWPIVIGASDFSELQALPKDEQAETTREILVKVMAKKLNDFDSLAQSFWFEMAFMDELEAEIARWAAAHTAHSRASDIMDAQLRWVQEEIAVRHGLSDWESLRSEVSDGKLFGAIPIVWVEDACHAIAANRAARSFGKMRNSTDHGAHKQSDISCFRPR